MTDALDGLDAARRAGWARAFAAEEAAAHMLFTLYLHMYLNSDRPDLDTAVGELVGDWLNGGKMAPGWVAGADEPPDLTPGQVDARIRIARRFLQLDGRTPATWDDPHPRYPDDTV